MKGIKLRNIQRLLPKPNFPTNFYSGEKCVKDCNIYKCRIACQWREHNNIIATIGNIEIGLDIDKIEELIPKACRIHPYPATDRDIAKIIVDNLKDLLVVKEKE